MPVTTLAALRAQTRKLAENGTDFRSFFDRGSGATEPPYNVLKRLVILALP
jgi:hypothetical protein